MSVKPQPLSWPCPEGEIQLAHPAPHIVRITMTGVVDANAGRQLGAALSASLRDATAPVHTFWDLGALTQYHTVVRVEATRALLGNLKNVAAIHALSTSALVRMGVSVANVALGGRVRSYAERPPFETAFTSALR